MSDDDVKEPETSESEAGEPDEASRPSRRRRRKRPADAEAKGDASSEGADAAKAEGEGKAALARIEPVKKVAGASDDDAGPAERRDLPKWNRARVKRKAPKGEEEDAFQTTVRKAGRGILQHPAAVIGLIVVAAGIGAGAYAWSQAGEADRAKSTTLLSTAAAYEARGQVVEDLAEQTADRKRPLSRPYVESEEELRQKVDAALADLEAKDPDSPANEVADLVRAARLARASDFEAAEKAYRSFIKRLPGHHLLFMAREGLVLALEGQERWDDALAEVEPMLGQEGDFYRDQALWHRGRLLEAAGRSDEALEVYKQYMAEYPLDRSSLAADQVRARLEELDPASVPALPESPMGMGGLGGLGIGP
ncbi:MAG: tetratricopeptide repeat protein [Myxococcales bacterium]|nr:tetratricopeptide repeat protein [Myxococcales bacterium]MCB9713686.1 tetratricopeptide repeat protein [Myxococcales bacterium]